MSLRWCVVPRAMAWLVVELMLALCTVTASAHEADAATCAACEGAPIIQLEFTGGTEPQRAAARSALLDVEKQPFSAVWARHAVRRVFASGPFADVQVWAQRRADGVQVDIKLVQQALVQRVDIQLPSDVLDARRLRELLPIRVGERFLPGMEATLARRTLEVLRGLGFHQAHVRVRAVAITGQSAMVRVVFDIEPHEPLRVASFVIQYSEAGKARRAPPAPLSRVDVEQRLGLRAGAPFERSALEQGLFALQQRLREAQHLAARAVIADLVVDDAGAHVVVDVDSGPRYRVRYSGNALLTTSWLAQAIGSEVTGVDDVACDGLAERVKALYQRQGFYRTRVKVFARLRDNSAPREPTDDARAELVIAIDEGRRSDTLNLRFSGRAAFAEATLAATVRDTLDAEVQTRGLLQRVDPFDVQDLLSPHRARRQSRPVEFSDEGLFFDPQPYIGRKAIYIDTAGQEAAARIADLYRAQGFLDVRVGDPVVQVNDDGAQLDVSFAINEGVQVTITDITLLHEQCTQLPICKQTLPAALLQVAAPLTAPLLARPANADAIADVRASLERELLNLGYPHARVSEKLLRPQAPQAGVVVYVIDPGPRVTVRSIGIVGNDATHDFVIRDRLALRVGDVFSAAQVARSRERLFALSVFSAVDIALVDDSMSEDGAADVIVTIKERPRFAIETGGGASLEDGPRAFVGAEWRNMLGFGVNVKGRAQANYPRAFYDVLYDPQNPNNPLLRFGPEPNPVVAWGRFFEGQASVGSDVPRVFLLPLETHAHFDAVALREIRPAFTLNRAAIVLGSDVTVWQPFTLSPQIEAELSDFDCPRDLQLGRSCGQGSVGLTRRRDAGFIRQGTLRLGSTLDWRDHPLRARSGVFLYGQADFALGSGTLRKSQDDSVATEVQSDFIKVMGGGSWYLPLSDQFVLAFALRGGNIFGATAPFGNAYVPLYKRFYLGGTNSVRGFREDQILPVDDAVWPASQQQPSSTTFVPQSLGGNFFANARSELRMTLWGDVDLGVFLDLGELANDVRQVSFAGVAAGAGFGLRYNTPVGPLVLDLGWRVVDGQRQLPALTSLERMNLHLAIGTF